MLTVPFALSLFTPPVSEPVTIAEAKQHCRVSVDDDDGLIQGYIQAAREHVEVETRRQLLPATWILGIDQFPCVRSGLYGSRYYGLASGASLPLPRPPLCSVTSVTYVDTDNVTQTLATTVYGVDTLREPGLVYLKSGQSWPSIGWQPNAVQVKYVAGYANAAQVPAMLKQAILLLVGHFYEQRESTVEKALTCIPDGVEMLLWNNRIEVL